MCTCVTAYACVVVVVFPWARAWVRGCILGMFWVEVCKTGSECESKRDVWMCDCVSSFTCGAVLVCMTSTLWCLSILGLIWKSCILPITFKPNLNGL